MNGTVKEWIEKAEGDYWTAHRELIATEHTNYDAVCYHSQQCIEKLLKGILVDNAALPPKTHDLIQLSHLVSGVRQDWAWDIKDLRFLFRAATGFRYPGDSADQKEASEAFEICERLRRTLLSLFKP